MIFDSNWHLDMESRIRVPRSERLDTYSKYNLRDIESTLKEWNMQFRYLESC